MLYKYFDEENKYMVLNINNFIKMYIRFLFSVYLYLVLGQQLEMLSLLLELFRSK